MKPSIKIGENNVTHIIHRLIIYTPTFLWICRRSYPRAVDRFADAGIYPPDKTTIGYQICLEMTMEITYFIHNPQREKVFLSTGVNMWISRG